ncbi:TRAP transporter small permease [Alteribacter salitolerans]|uniref:TRAP transporter small permease n=1 Tax=Alteribacter salitolerans TaxID=2912333 RepID=UPI001965C4DA|nr:TRAP transporter small permease [Alteribacter salitolerans]
MKNVRKYFFSVIKYLNISILLLMFGLLILQVVTRRLLNTPLPWPEEFALLCMIWITFFGAYQLTVENRHLKMDFLETKIPDQYRVYFQVFSKILIAGFLVMISIKGFSFIGQVGGTSMPVSGLPMWLPYCFIWISCILMLIEVVYQIVKQLIEVVSGDAAVENQRREVK